MQHRAIRSTLGAAAAAILLAACADVAPFEVDTFGPRASVDTAPQLLECPLPAGGWTASIMVGPAGGSWANRGARISIPEGAVPVPTRFTVTVPATTFAEIAVTADGHAGYNFAKPISIDIPYDRCPSLASANLGVWYIDSVTKAPLEFMGGVNNSQRRVVTFQTDHLSGYAIAN